MSFGTGSLIFCNFQSNELHFLLVSIIPNTIFQFIPFLKKSTSSLNGKNAMVCRRKKKTRKLHVLVTKHKNKILYINFGKKM